MTAQRVVRVHKAPIPVAERGVLSVVEAAAYLCLGHNGVRALLDDGSLIGWKTSHHGAWRISRAELDRWIERQEAQRRAEVIRAIER